MKVNGEPTGLSITRKWKKGDVIELTLDMPVRLVEANPLVEEAKNQVAVMRGPIVYCLEGQDVGLPSGTTAGRPHINDITIPADIRFTEVPIEIARNKMLALDGEAFVSNEHTWDNNTLYRTLRRPTVKKVKIRLIPYYAWDNRGIDDMSLWLNVKH